MDEPREVPEMDGARLDVGVVGFDPPPSAASGILRRVNGRADLHREICLVCMRVDDRDPHTDEETCGW